MQKYKLMETLQRNIVVVGYSNKHVYISPKRIKIVSITM